MRLCVNQDDPGFQTYQALQSAKVMIEVFVDGEPINDVSMADDVLGRVIHEVRDASGGLKRDGDQSVSEMLRGSVEIRISPKPEPVDEPEPEITEEPAPAAEPQPQPEPVAAEEPEEQPVEAHVDGE